GLDRRPAGDGRDDGARRVGDRRRPVALGAARGAAGARTRARRPGDARAARRVLPQAQRDGATPAEARHHVRGDASEHVLLLGLARAAAGAVRRRDALLPAGARAQGADRSRAVLRRQPGRLPQGPLAVRAVDALLVRAAARQHAAGSRPARAHARPRGGPVKFAPDPPPPRAGGADARWLRSTLYIACAVAVLSTPWPWLR